MREIDVFFVENSGPLERSTVETLACSAMAVFRSQRTITAEFVFHAPTVTSTLPFDFEVLIFIVNAVRGTVFPLILLAMSGRTGLVLVRFVHTLASISFAAFSRRIRHLSRLS